MRVSQDSITATEVPKETIPFPTEGDALQAMKDEGAFDELRRALLECLDKTPSYTSLKNDLGSDIDHFLSNQKWKNSTEHHEQLRKNLRIHIKSPYPKGAHEIPYVI